MAHHHARDGYETVKVPEKFRPLLRRLQRGTWTAQELTCERWFLITTKGLSRGDAEAAGAMIEITRADVLALDLVPCGGRDVRGLPRETYFVYRGDPDGDNDWKLS